MATKNQPDWQYLLDDIFNSSTHIVNDLLGATKDIYATWLKKDAVTNTPLHRKERRKPDGTENAIK